MSGTRAISTTSRRELSSCFFVLQGKAPKEIHAILTETLACFLPGLAKDLSAPLYNPPSHGAVTPSVPSGLQVVPLQGKAPKEIHAILTETLACFLPGRAKDLSARRRSLYPVYRFCDTVARQDLYKIVIFRHLRPAGVAVTDNCVTC